MTSESPTDAKQKARQSLEDVILRVCGDRGAGKSVDPTEVAKAFTAGRGEDDLAWRGWLSQVRATAIGLARQGRLVIYRKGKPADPDDFRGVWRMGLPRAD